MKHLEKLTTRKIALIAIFSALYYVLSFLPGIKIATAAANVTIQIEAFMASIFGLTMGPYLGALTAFMGALIAWILPPGIPSPTSAIFIPAPVINAFIVGLVYTKKWKIAFVTLAAVVLAFWFLPPAQPLNQYFYVGLMAMWDKIAALALIIPATMLMSKMAKGSVKVSENTDKVTRMKKVDLTLILSIIAAVLILINAGMIASEGNVINFQYRVFETPLETTFKFKFGFKDLILLTASYGYIWLLLGVGILIFAALLYFKPKKRFIWSILIFTLSCLSAFIGGGFLVGLFLGVLGGIFGTLKRKFALPRITNLEVLLYFLLAFIGNEADNALGNDIFAVPLVYEGIFQIPSLDILRGLFIVAPFFYFAVRLFQAVITTLIATPLIRNLKAAGLETTQPSEARKK